MGVLIQHVLRACARGFVHGCDGAADRVHRPSVSISVSRCIVYVVARGSVCLRLVMNVFLVFAYLDMDMDVSHLITLYGDCHFH